MVSNDFVSVDLHLPRKDSLSQKASEKRKIGSVSYVVSYFREYCNSTSIHGFRYFGEPRTIFEKIWWFIVFAICLILCVFSILAVYRKWDTSPVIVTFATKGKPLHEIPFPAVTVCSESKVKHSVFDYTSAITRKIEGDVLNEQEESFLDVLSYVCHYRDDFNYSTVQQSESDNFLDILRKVSPDFSIINCKYGGRSYPCDKLFTPIVTDDGICYTFNLLDRTELYNENVVHYRHFHNVGKTSEDWSVEHGYRKEAGVATYPVRALLAGARYGLKFELKIINEKLDTMCRGSVEGYRILFHGAFRAPQPSQQYMLVPYNQALSATISSSPIVTSDAVKNYPPQKRQCYFSFEKKLKYFKIYSQKNCDTECLTNFTLFFCECVPFYMPRENNSRICGAMDHECTHEAEYFLQYMSMYKRISLKRKNVPQFLKEHVCLCMPMCSDIEYKAESSQSIWNWSAETKSELYLHNETDNITNYYMSKVTAYFVNSYFIGSERNELYGPTDFLANFGGLLGLFTGFSILSLMEIIYFLSVRLICNLRLYGNWAGHKT